MNRRLIIAERWFMGSRHGVGFSELVNHLFGPTCRTTAEKHLEDVTEDRDYLKVAIRGLRDPLFWPRALPVHQLYQTIAEILNPRDWHYYETAETPVQPEDVVADCGAAEGLFALSVAHRCKKVYAIEPHPGFEDSMNLTFRNLSNVEVVAAALSDTNGVGYLSDLGICSAVTGSGSGHEVKIAAMDSLFAGTAVTYIKADLEGCEVSALRCAERLIRANKPRLAITTYHKQHDARDIAQYLRQLVPDYRVKVKGIDHVWGASVMLHAWVEPDRCGTANVCGPNELAQPGK